MRINVTQDSALQEPEAQEFDINSAMEEYVKVNAEAKKVNGRLDELKKQIREFLLDREFLDYSSDTHRAYLSKREKVNMDEGGLIIRLKELDITDPIEVKEVLNNRVLEDAMVRGELPPDEVQPYLSTQTTYVLYVKEIR